MALLPAAVTPFDEKGRVDGLALARLLAWFEAGGCSGAVVAGTNGEGPSLSAPEKRDLVQAAVAAKGKLEIVLGIATPSLDEAIWLCKQAASAGADGVLVMPPGYFREADEAGIEAWFRAVLDASPTPVLLYNFPKRTGITLSAGLMERLSGHERLVGVKDSSGDASNLDAYRSALRPEHRLFVGDERLLVAALEAGWTGSISGAANVLPDWLSEIDRLFHAGEREQAGLKHQLLLPAIEALRAAPQPATNKRLLEMKGVLPGAGVRLPLREASKEDVENVATQIRKTTGS
jgi:4-hydroxy-tetrahydrodipicolinate synthase